MPLQHKLAHIIAPRICCPFLHPQLPQTRRRFAFCGLSVTSQIPTTWHAQAAGESEVETSRSVEVTWLGCSDRRYLCGVVWLTWCCGRRPRRGRLNVVSHNAPNKRSYSLWFLRVGVCIRVQIGLCHLCPGIFVWGGERRGAFPPPPWMLTTQIGPKFGMSRAVRLAALNAKVWQSIFG